MEVLINGNEVIVVGPSRYVVGQLSFWGFKKNEEENFYIKGEDSGVILEKLVSFFSSEHIEFELSLEAQALFNQRMNLINDFERRKKVLARFKEGDFDMVEYKKFNDFLISDIPRKLKEHQKKSAFHLYLAKNGANFSVPGSGKTTVVLSVYEKLRKEGLEIHCL